MFTTRLPRTFLALLLFWAMGQTLAQEASPAPSLYVQANWAKRGTDAYTWGATLPWREWSQPLGDGELHGHWDIYLSRWHFDGAPGSSHRLTLLGVTPTLRLRPDSGHSAWFLEAGIGGTLASRRYYTVHKKFSTRFNFASHVGVGIYLGAQQQHELLLRVQHVSNASIKHPNPGENFFQLRYALHF